MTENNKREELLKELENRLNDILYAEVFTNATAAFVSKTIWQLYEDAYSHGEISEMPEDISVRFDEKTRTLKACVTWPPQKMIKCTFHYSPIKTE